MKPQSKYWKFRSDNEFTEQIFMRKEFWFSKPKQFNDPFDCQRSLVDVFSEIQIPSDRTGIAFAVALVLDSIMKPNAPEEAYLCLCQNYEHTLMWSHYSDEHRGISIGLRENPSFQANRHIRYLPIDYEGDKLKELAQNVIGHINPNTPIFPFFDKNGMIDEYFKQANPELTDFFEDAKKMLAAAHFTKAECWQYEEETRFQYLDREKLLKSSGINIKITESDVQDVIFGANCAEATRAKYSALLSGQEWKHVKLWQAEPDYAHRLITVTELNEARRRQKKLDEKSRKAIADEFLKEAVTQFGHEGLMKFVFERVKKNQ